MTKDNRIAVVGISAILPGGENINECWDMIREGIDCLSDLPADRVDVTAYYNPKKGVKDKIYCKRGGFIPDYDFDAREFGMNMFQVEDSDANQTLSLLKVKEALEDGGLNPFTKEKKNIGVVLGIGGGQKSMHEFYSRMNYTVVEKVLRKIGMSDEEVENAVNKYKNNFPEWRLDSFPGMLGNVTAGRCTNVFNLQGMNCVVDAACASSLISLKVAIDELLHGDCDEMICGATCTDNSLAMYMAFSKTPVFSTDQSLTAYDQNTKGMLIGEGSVMLLLKRYSDAVRDGNQIHAVIEGVASSSDGKASGIYSPTVRGQELAIQRAYAKAGISPGDVSLVEGHGTGTPVGDRIELTGLKNVFKPYFKDTEEIAVGSIKSQVGHLKACAGMAGLVKVIMGLKHKVLPRSINVKNPPVLFDDTKIQDSPLYINTQMRPWFTKGGKKRIAGVSSFGFGGANYHAVVSEAETEQTTPYRMHDLPQPVVLSASTGKALSAVVSAQLKELTATSDYKALCAFRQSYAIRPIAQTEARVGFLSVSIEQTISNLEAIKQKLDAGKNSKQWTLIRQGCHFRPSGIHTNGKTAALFSGQGAQYLNMFADVAMNWPTFRETVTRMDKVSENICNVRTSKILYPRKRYDAEEKITDEEISSVQNAQICTVACSIGSYKIFRKAGFTHDFAAGHSLGEFAALYSSGAIKTEDDLFNIVASRGKIMSESNSGKGAMLAVIGPGASSLTISTSNVYVGNSNSPDQVVLTGEDKAIDKEAEILKSKYKCVKLNVSDAFHSKYMDNANNQFLKEINQYSLGNPSKTKVFSNVSTKPYTSDVLANLKSHMTSTVEFEKQIWNMYNQGARVFVEFGPRNTLIKLVENILKAKQDIFTVAVNNTSRIDSETQLRECALKMCIAGIPLSNFDPWPVLNRFKLKTTVRKKTTLRLTAATYVSKKTLKARAAVMDDGFKVSKNSGPTSSPPANDNLKRELEASKKINIDLKRRLDLASTEIERLQKEVANIESQSTTQTNSNDFVEMNTLKKHRELIVDMLGEYDKMMDSLTQADAVERMSVSRFLPPEVPKAVSEVRDVSQVFKKIENTVFDVLAEKTGYEVEMIEPDMELETELGIDSIKRVEILSEVQSLLSVEVSDVDALSRTRTVGDVINAIRAEFDASAPTSSAINTSEDIESAGMAVNQGLLNRAEQAVMSVLAEKTGYEVEMIESDMELETELGIDSIKRVEILSEVQSMLSIEAKDVDALSRTRTVGEVIDCMKKEISGAPINVPEPVSSLPPTTSNTSVDLSKAEDAVLKVLADKTGYDVDMIENDMELETELGIDSIKRVEILSEVQDILGVEAKDVDALSRTRTVGEVVQAMKNEILGGASSAPVSSAAVSTAVPPSGNSDLLNKAGDVVLQVLADKTGYEVDMIEDDMELETELGIDSIKRVEILSEVQDILNVEAKDVDALSRTRTVGEVVAAMRAEIGDVETSEIGTAMVTSGIRESSSSNDTFKKAEEIVLQVLAEKTGYEVDMIENDMELETELGIDSIKRVEILSEVQDLLGIEAKDVDALSRTRTVGEVINAMKAEVTDAPMGESPVKAPSSNVASADSLAKAEEAVLNVLAEKTGYEVEMIELDMELETELGIDSIKRVEILSEVQDILGIEAKDVDALSRTRTVGEVIDVMKIEMGGAQTTDIAPVPSSVPAVNSSSSTADLARAEKVVLDVLAEKTGYEVDMIEQDMELETELGIDSIKRVEILSEVQDLLSIEAKDVDALSRTRTVGEVIEAMKLEIGGSTPVIDTTEPSVNVGVSIVADTSAAEDTVLKVLADKTGYEVDMIEKDMELETELGIDSIKRVEILSEVQALLNIEAKDVDALSRTRTVGEVIDALKAELGNSPASSSMSSFVVVPPGQLEEAERVVFQVLAEKTGYEVDMIESDMELETELGIDSIKRVEILSEVQEILKIEAKNVDALSRTRTVGEVIDALQKEISDNLPTTTAAKASNSSSDSDSFDLVSFDYNDYTVRGHGSEELNISFPGIVELNSATKSFDIKLGGIVVCGDAILARKLKSELGVQVTSLPIITEEKEIQKLVSSLSSVETFIYVQTEQAAVVSMMYMKYVGKQLTGRKQVMVLVRGDGQLGYSGNLKSIEDLEKYSLCGLVKTLALEWPDVKTKIVDVSEDNEVVSSLVSELYDTNYMVKEIGYKQGKRYGVTIKGLRGESTSIKPDSSDVWLVSGGARGITPLCIRELAREVQGGKYILVGRSKLSPLPEWAEKFKAQSDVSEKDIQKAAIQYIKSTGEKPRPAMVKSIVKKVFGTLEVTANMADIGQYCGGAVEYVSCDINDTVATKSLVDDLRASGTTITGFFHASGVLRDKLLVQKKREDFDLVYNTKVKGFLNLYNQLDSSKLKHCVVFSSLAGFYGNNGQSDYSMANEFLNKVSYFLSKRGVCSKAFDFGPWDGGMVSPALKKHFIENRVQIIDRQPGAVTVAKIMLNSTRRQVLVGNWRLIPKKSESSVSSLSLVFVKQTHILDHAIKGVPVLPFTYAVSAIVRETLGIYPGYNLKAIKSVKFFRGLRFVDTKQITTNLTVEESGSSGGSLLLSAKLDQETGPGKSAPSYKIELELTPTFAEVSSPKQHFPAQFGTTLSKEQLYDGETLFHGKTFQGISRVEYDDSRIVAAINLEGYDFETVLVEPLVLDIIFQVALVHARKVGNQASLPASFSSAEFSSDFFNGSRSFKNLFVVLKKNSKSSNSSWCYDFTVQDNINLCAGEAAVTLNANLSYK